MSRIRDTLKNKNRVEKARKARRKNEIASLRDTSIFKARLYDELKHLEVILDDSNIKAVKITVDSKFINKFVTSIYSEDLASYDVEQVPDQPNMFYIRRKYISF